MSKLITPEFRGSFVNLTKPHNMPGETDEDKARYQITIVLPKKDKFWKTINEQIDATASEKWTKVPKALKRPIKDGDAEDDDGELKYPEFEGCYTLQVSTKRKPGVVDKALQPILNADELYSGAWYRASIKPYAWSHPTGGNGVSFSVDNVMKVKDDTPLGGAAEAPEKEFAEFAEEKGASAELLD